MAGDYYKFVNAVWGAKVAKGEAPLGVSSLFEPLTTNNRAKMFKLPRYKTETNKRLSTVHSISKTWNDLPIAC